MNGIVSFRLCTLSDEELIARVDRGCDEMYQTGEIPTRHIPARPDSDFDLLVGELILRFRAHICKSSVISQNNALPDFKNPPPPPTPKGYRKD